MEAVGKHDFSTNDPANELAFRKGDKLLILNYGDPVQWYNAEMNGHTGLVPENYIHIEKPSWYYGRISRSIAERMLQGNKCEGAFLVRLSESSPTAFSLSVKCAKQVQHFRILKATDNKYFLWQERFDSLNKLVDYYRTETVSRNSTVYLQDMETDNQFIVEALYDFASEDQQNGETELEFKIGELITVFETSDDNWWGGSIGDRTGYFPKTYVKKYEPSFFVRRC